MGDINLSLNTVQYSTCGLGDQLADELPDRNVGAVKAGIDGHKQTNDMTIAAIYSSDRGRTDGIGWKVTRLFSNL